MIKRVLVPLDLSRYSAAAVKTACDLAKAHNAEVEGIVVAEPPVTTEMEHRRNAAFATFQQICLEKGVRHVEEQTNGVPAQQILAEARTYDLVVLGLRTHYRLDDPEQEGNALEEILSATATPILAVPPDGAVPFEKVVIAYDGSVPAARALREFTRIARPLDDPELTIVCSDRIQTKANACVQGARAYLEAYSFNWIETATTDGRLYEYLADNYLGAADLVVAGIHTRALVRDFFIGSFTRELLAHGQKALLLAH